MPSLLTQINLNMLKDQPNFPKHKTPKNIIVASKLPFSNLKKEDQSSKKAESAKHESSRSVLSHITPNSDDMFSEALKSI